MAKRRTKKSKGSCIYVPKVNSEPSDMYIGLINKGVERPLVNLVYTKYLTSDAPKKMDAAGFKRNEQGQHNAEDVYKFFNVRSIVAEQGYSLSKMENKYKVLDSNGERKLMSAQEAYQIASNVNQNEKSFVAEVIQRGDYFTVIIDKLSGRTEVYRSDVESSILAWQALENGFRNLNLDLDYVALASPDLINPRRIKDFLSYMGRLSKTDVKNFNIRDINILLRTGKNEPLVQNLLNYDWGSTEETAAKAYDVIINPSNYAADTVNFVQNALTQAKQANTVEFKALKDNITDTSKGSHSVLKTYYDSSSEISAYEKLKELHKKYGIDHSVINMTDSKINRLSEAASEAILTLERQRRYLEDQEGRIQEGIEIEQTLNQLADEIDKKKYYSGLLTFLQKANGYGDTISRMLQSIPEGGTTLEHSVAVGKVLAKAKNFHDGYSLVVNALAEAGTLLIDESISQEDLNLLVEQARQIKRTIEIQEKAVADLRQNTMLDMAQEILGSDAANGRPLADLVKFAESDSSIMDFMYSCERVSDPLVSVMGTVIRDAQLERDKKLREFAERIRTANRKLADSKSDSKFMYSGFNQTRIDWKAYNEAKEAEKQRLKKEGYRGGELYAMLGTWINENTEEVNGVRLPNDSWKTEKTVYYITSNHNWEEFYKARRQQERALHKAGVKGFAFKDAMNVWENENMVDEPVDVRNDQVIRTEKVPNSSYDINPNGFDDYTKFWSPAQREYYDTMMQIKGEIGTMLPFYAQKQYLPPQRRASWVDIITQGKEREMTAKEVAKNLLDRMNPLSVKQDDTSFLDGAIFGEDDTVLSRSNYDDTLLRRIPIYYTNMLRNQEDLDFDFSGAVQALAATATNYDAMYGVKDLVENMADFLKERRVAERDADGKKRFDIIKWGEVIIGKAIRKLAKSTNTTRLVDGFVSKHIYNEQLARGNEGGLLRKGQLLMQALINYTSVNQLAPNLKGAFSNWLVGEAQMMIESGAMQYYNPINYFRAHRLMFGRGVRIGTVMDHLSNTTNTLGHLLEERFDPLQEVYTDLGGKRYLTGFKKLFGGFNVMGLYSAGESLIHLTNMYAVLDHEKVLMNGRKTSLYSVLDRETGDDGITRLVIKEGATKLDGHAIDEEYLNTVQDKIRLVNQKTHGSMNSEDKGLIHRNMAGRAVMNFRQWMVEHYSRRYRGRYFDGTTRTWQEGYYNTLFKAGKGYINAVADNMRNRQEGYYSNVFGLAKSWIKDFVKANVEAAARWNDLDETQKGNVRRAFSEFAVFGALLGVSAALGDPKDHKGEWGYRFLIYQVRRLILDESASIPPVPAVTGGFVQEGLTLLNSPVASVKTINGFLYPITGIGEINDTYQRGPHKGENKYWVKFRKQTLPFYGQIDQLIRMGDEDYIFNIFDNISYNKAQ